MHVPEGWSITKLEEISEIRSGSTPLRSKGERYFSNDGIPWVKTLDLNNARIEDTEEKITDLALQETSCSVFPVDTVLVAMYGGFNQIGRTGVLGMPAAINQALSALIIDNSKALSQYVLYFLNGNVKRWKQFAASSRKDPNITQSDVKNFAILLPPLAEQEKIAEILSTWDHTIEQTERLKANAETHKQALMQQLLTGKKRFPEFEGEWEEYKTKQIFKSIVRRAEGGEYEIFSVTKDGIIPQKEYFKKEIASKNTDNYKVIEFGDFVMSGLNFWMGSVDVYLEEYSGMISPAYKVYTIKKGFDISYIKHFVRSFEFNRVLVGSSILGASIVRRNFDSVAFDNWKLKLPSLEEQQKIAAVLNRADREIELLAQKLDYLKTEKRALMQQLLTGKRRVKVDG